MLKVYNLNYYYWLEQPFHWALALGLGILKVLCLGVFLYGCYALLKKKKHPSLRGIKQQSYKERYQETAYLLASDMPLAVKRHKDFKGKRQEAQQKRPFLYVIDFDGDMKAAQAEQFSDIVSTLIELLAPKDKVLLRLQSSGGLVPHYGYAALQLRRLVKHTHLTVAVDKIAASGGYLMACVAHEIIAAPFAIVGSIGVVGVVPHLHPWLKNHGIEVQEHTAGEYKRSLTPWGEQTPEKVERYYQELAQTHELFKSFVQEQRPAVAPRILETGEYRYAAHSVGTEGLVDRVLCSEEFIAEHLEKYHVIFVSCEHESPWWHNLLGLGVSLSEKVWRAYAGL